MSTVPVDAYRCTCKAGYANGVCGYSFNKMYVLLAYDINDIDLTIICSVLCSICSFL